MRFTLYYRGRLKANGDLKHKQALRRYFHRQLDNLWNTLPLSHLAPELDKPSTSSIVTKEIGNWKFSSIVNTKLHTLAELDIIMLRPGSKRVIAQGGDIDNRLKTLLDALSIPIGPEQIPSKDTQTGDETPLHCLLEDDGLIVGVSVSADQLLDCKDTSEVVLLVRVSISGTVATRGNLSLIGR